MGEKVTEQVEDSGPTTEETAGPEQDRQETSAPECQNAAEKIADLEVQLAEAKDQYLRKAADFENFRKRMNREKLEAIDFANQNLLLDLIPIIDDFERAIGSFAAAGAEAGDGTDARSQALYEGIAMIEKRLVTQLENKWGLKRFDSAGEIFDPNRHEAIMVEKSPDTAESIVQEDLIKGYALKDRIIRSAKVKVLMPENPPETPEETPPELPGSEKEPNKNTKETIEKESV